jgi:hypothetical protein
MTNLATAHTRLSGRSTPARIGTEPDAAHVDRTDAAAFAELDLDTLYRRCVMEHECYARKQPYDPGFAYELFRRALAECDQDAWRYIYTCYQQLVDYWVRRTKAFAHSGESSEYFIGAALARFWAAIPPERFGCFPSLASLLHYLFLCATSVVIDGARTHVWVETLGERDAAWRRRQVSAEEEVINRMSREVLWTYVDAKLRNEEERVVIFNDFVMGMKPREIHQTYPNMFASVNEIYVVKRNVLDRLGRDQELRKLLS